MWTLQILLLKPAIDNFWSKYCLHSLKASWTWHHPCKDWLRVSAIALKQKEAWCSWSLQTRDRNQGKTRDNRRAFTRWRALPPYCVKETKQQKAPRVFRCLVKALRWAVFYFGMLLAVAMLLTLFVTAAPTVTPQGGVKLKSIQFLLQVEFFSKTWVSPNNFSEVQSCSAEVCRVCRNTNATCYRNSHKAPGLIQTNVDIWHDT